MCCPCVLPYLRLFFPPFESSKIVTGLQTDLFTKDPVLEMHHCSKTSECNQKEVYTNTSTMNLTISHEWIYLNFLQHRARMCRKVEMWTKRVPSTCFVSWCAGLTLCTDELVILRMHPHPWMRTTVLVLNSSYAGGRVQGDQVFRPARAKS
jgi:hypothetical protein